MSTGTYFSAAAIAVCAINVIRPIRDIRDRLTMRVVPESWLIKYSLWDECDGEPMNCWADELVRRDAGGNK